MSRTGRGHQGTEIRRSRAEKFKLMYGMEDMEKPVGSREEESPEPWDFKNAPENEPHESYRMFYHGNIHKKG
jgi:hypothetical protein